MQSKAAEELHSVVNTEPLEKKYKLGKELGQGAFAIVREATSVASGEAVRSLASRLPSEPADPWSSAAARICRWQ
jgi:hypothetical protein